MTSAGVLEVAPTMDVEVWTHWRNSSELSLHSLGGRPYPSLYSWTHIGLSAFVVTAIMLLIVGGNSLVVAAITRDRRRLGGVQNYFIASLAVSDLLVGLFIPVSCVKSFTRGRTVHHAAVSSQRADGLLGVRRAALSAVAVHGRAAVHGVHSQPGDDQSRPLLVDNTRRHLPTTEVTPATD